MGPKNKVAKVTSENANIDISKIKKERGLPSSGDMKMGRIPKIKKPETALETGSGSSSQKKSSIHSSSNKSSSSSKEDSHSNKKKKINWQNYLVSLRKGLIIQMMKVH